LEKKGVKGPRNIRENQEIKRERRRNGDKVGESYLKIRGSAASRSNLPLALPDLQKKHDPSLRGKKPPRLSSTEKRCKRKKKKVLKHAIPRVKQVR